MFAEMETVNSTLMMDQFWSSRWILWFVIKFEGSFNLIFNNLRYLTSMLRCTFTLISTNHRLKSTRRKFYFQSARLFCAGFRNECQLRLHHHQCSSFTAESVNEVGMKHRQNQNYNISWSMFKITFDCLKTFWKEHLCTILYLYQFLMFTVS